MTLKRKDSFVDIELGEFGYYTDGTYFVADGVRTPLSTRVRFTTTEMYIGGISVSYEQIPHFTNHHDTSIMYVFADMCDDKLVKADKIGQLVLRFEDTTTALKFHREIYARMIYVRDNIPDVVDRTVFKFKSFKKIMSILLKNKR
jgi:hypothetical protein